MRDRKIRMDDIEDLIEAYAVGNQKLIGWERVVKRTTIEELRDYLKGIGCNVISGKKIDLIKKLAEMTCPSGY